MMLCMPVVPYVYSERLFVFLVLHVICYSVGLTTACPQNPAAQEKLTCDDLHNLQPGKIRWKKAPRD
jgi:hypothetical protein